jgi:hypothetical protein
MTSDDDFPDEELRAAFLRNHPEYVGKGTPSGPLGNTSTYYSDDQFADAFAKWLGDVSGQLESAAEARIRAHENKVQARVAEATHRIHGQFPDLPEDLVRRAVCGDSSALAELEREDEPDAAEFRELEPRQPGESLVQYRLRTGDRG